MHNFTMKTFNSGEAFDEPARGACPNPSRACRPHREQLDHQDGTFFLHDLNGNRCGDAVLTLKRRTR
jgi:hypothetical protein